MLGRLATGGVPSGPEALPGAWGPDVGQWATEHQQAITTAWLDRVSDPEALDGLPAALRGHADTQLAAGPGGRAWKAAFGARFDDLPPPHRAALIAGAEHGELHDIDRHVRGVAADLTSQRRELASTPPTCPPPRCAPAKSAGLGRSSTPCSRPARPAGGVRAAGAGPDAAPAPSARPRRRDPATRPATPRTDPRSSCPAAGTTT